MGFDQFARRLRPDVEQGVKDGEIRHELSAGRGLRVGRRLEVLEENLDSLDGKNPVALHVAERTAGAEVEAGFAPLEQVDARAATASKRRAAAS